jgi:hypothetical protein
MLPSEPELSRIAHARIEDGQLGCEPPAATWGGYGDGTLCELCGEPIGPADVEYEVQMVAHRGRTHRFHLLCHTVWRVECARREGQ